MFDDQLPRLDGLLALSRTEGLDMRRTLLRVLTDLFVAAPQRAPADVARFTELAGHLIGQVDEETRVVVAAKLGPCPFTPRTVIDSLIASEPDAAARVIETSPALLRDDLWALAADGGPVTDAAIARRPDLDGEMVRFLARKAYPPVAEALAHNRNAPLDRESVALLAPLGPKVPGLAEALAVRPDVEAQWLAPLFLDLPAKARMAVLAAGREEAAAPRFAIREAQVMAPKLVLDGMEHAALARDRAGLAGGLAMVFGVEEATALRIVADASGEALALMLVSAGMPLDQATRVMMFANEGVGASVDEFRRLVDLMASTPRAAATRLVRTFTDTRPPDVAPEHEPLFAEPSPKAARGRKASRRGETREAAETRRKGEG